jgi:hypothetical protein
MRGEKFNGKVHAKCGTTLRYVYGKNRCVACALATTLQWDKDHPGVGKDRTRKRRIEHPDKDRAYLIGRHGINAAEYEALAASQGHRCYVCRSRSAKRLSIDHDHSHCPGHFACRYCIRTLACNYCNRYLIAALDAMDNNELEMLGYINGQHTEFGRALYVIGKRPAQRVLNPEGR